MSRECECFLQSTCLQQFLIHDIRAQPGNFVTECLAHLVHSAFRGGTQIKGSKQRPQLLEAYGCGGDSSIQVYVLNSSTLSSSWFMYLLIESLKSGITKLQFTHRNDCATTTPLFFFFGRLKLGPGAVV